MGAIREPGLTSYQTDLPNAETLKKQMAKLGTHSYTLIGEHMARALVVSIDIVHNKKPVVIYTANVAFMQLSGETNSLTIVPKQLDHAPIRLDIAEITEYKYTRHPRT